MSAVGVDDPLSGELPEPAVERERPLPEVVVQPPGGLDQGLLDDVRHIDAGGQAAVEPHRDHPPQVVPVMLQELLAGDLIPPVGAVD